MVKNIVFDIGNVLATFQPKDFLFDLFKDQSKVELYYNLLFKELWHKYDQGIYLKEDIVEIVDKQYREDIELIMEQWLNYLYPIDVNIQCIDEYKSKGYKAYIISNLPNDSYEYIINHFDFIQKMDGGIYSYEHLLIKPDRRIFELFLKTYQLNVDECLFIDDNQENINMAGMLGFHTIHLKEPFELVKLLKEKLNEV